MNIFTCRGVILTYFMISICNVFIEALYTARLNMQLKSKPAQQDFKKAADNAILLY